MRPLPGFSWTSCTATEISLSETSNLHGLPVRYSDFSLAEAWLADPEGLAKAEGALYVRAWQHVGRPADRARQLKSVLAVGTELDRLTRMPGLRMMLKMMRRPANAAGLGSLQQFLESGFDTFAAMSGNASHAQVFLNRIETRETHWIAQLFSDDVQTTQNLLAIALASEANANI
jgi:hypothetical protein